MAVTGGDSHPAPHRPAPIEIMVEAAGRLGTHDASGMDGCDSR